MAGKKGRSGGPRANSGGARPGAGRPKKPRSEADQEPFCDGNERDPLTFLLDVMNGKIGATDAQIRAATSAAQYVHAKKGEGGKKENDKDAASKIASGGKYAPASSPRLN